MLSKTLIGGRTFTFYFFRKFASASVEVNNASSSGMNAAERIAARKKEERIKQLEESCKSLPSFKQVLAKNGFWPLRRVETTTMQVNIGLLCNQTCHHCHVEAGPTRKKENMDKSVVNRLLQLLDSTPSIKTIDITGGAPEMNPNFKYLVENARKRGKSVIDRCNLTILLEKGMEDMAQFLADNEVTIVASLPCYSVANVEKQRGKGVFDKSITALLQLNKLGYGIEGSQKELNLVFNPVGASLPGKQDKLEKAYKETLFKDWGIHFNKLFTITNMPIKRFADSLYRDGELTKYMSLLVNHFNPSTVEPLMCRNIVSISWEGKLYDCDFNQMLELDIGAAANRAKDGSKSLSIWNVENLDFKGEDITTARHCFGCTAGAGSSCTGSLS